MDPTIRQLKHRYRVNTALNQVLPLADMGFPLPLSTGSPLFDAALTEKLQTTASITEAEHLARSWELCQRATEDEIGVLADHMDGLLNNFKLLLALTCWERGDTAQAATFVNALPWRWRFAFPIAVLKPASHFFTGWRRNTRFRLVQNSQHPELRQLFSDTLDKANESTILKFRSTIKEAAALQRYRFEGDRQQAIHDLSFNNGRDLQWPDSEGGVLDVYLRAREVPANDSAQLARTLTNDQHNIPLTSFMGLIGNSDANLKDDRVPAVGELRTYALRSATAVESLLRLSEWSEWLTDEHIESLSAKVRHQIIDRGVPIPFYRVIAAFNESPKELRKKLVEPLLTPLMQHFGRQVADLLPPPGPATFVMPANTFRISSFLLYAVVAHITDTRFLLLGNDGVSEQPDFQLEEVLEHLADDPDETIKWLLVKFGSASLDLQSGWYTYDVDHLASVLSSELDPEAPLILDLPLFYNASLLRSLSKFDRVFNLSASMGSPGELSIAPSYYRNFSYTSPTTQYSSGPGTAIRQPATSPKCSTGFGGSNGSGATPTSRCRYDPLHGPDLAVRRVVCGNRTLRRRPALLLSRRLRTRAWPVDRLRYRSVGDGRQHFATQSRGVAQRQAR